MTLLSKPSAELIFVKTSGVKYSEAREIKLVLIVASTAAQLLIDKAMKPGPEQLFSDSKRLRFNK
jgi:hypothetical protein